MTHSSRVQGPESCEFYGGQWAGDCTDSDGVNESRTLRISQKSCSELALRIDESDPTLSLTSSNTQSNDSTLYVWSMTSLLSWDFTKAKLNLVRQFYGRDRTNDFSTIAEEWEIFQFLAGQLRSQSILVNKDLRAIPNQDVMKYRVTCAWKRVN